MTIGFVTSATSPEGLEGEKRAMYDLLAARGRVVFVNPRRLAYVVTQGRVKILNNAGELPPLKVLIAFSTAGRVRATGFFVEMLKLAQPNCKLLDGDRYMKDDNSKLFSSADRAYRGVGPITYVAFGVNMAKKLATHMQFPAVVKPIDGRRGEGVTKVDQRQWLGKVREFFARDEEPEDEATVDGDTPIMAQLYMPKKHEYRVYLLDGEVIGSVRKGTRANPEQQAGFERMVRWGGGIFLEATNVGSKDFAKANTRVREGLVGIDVLWLETGRGGGNKYMIIEENRAPGGQEEFLAVTGVSIAQAIAMRALVLAGLPVAAPVANANGEYEIECDEREFE